MEVHIDISHAFVANQKWYIKRTRKSVSSATTEQPLFFVKKIEEHVTPGP
jgi:hypothetical protein